MSDKKSPERTDDMSGKPKTKIGKLALHVWDFAKSSQPIYLAVFLMVCYAVWEAKTPVTMIAPFQVPNDKPSFTGDIVADSVQDALKSIRNEIESEKQDMSLRSSETGLPDLRNMLMPRLWQVQAPPRFTVEVKGVSYGRILSRARNSWN